MPPSLADRLRRDRCPRPRTVGVRRRRPRLGSGKQLCHALARRGVPGQGHPRLDAAIRTPLVITAEEIDWAVDQFAGALAEVAS